MFDSVSDVQGRAGQGRQSSSCQSPTRTGEEVSRNGGADQRQFLRHAQRRRLSESCHRVDQAALKRYNAGGLAALASDCTRRTPSYMKGSSREGPCRPHQRATVWQGTNCRYGAEEIASDDHADDQQNSNFRSSVHAEGGRSNIAARRIPGRNGRRTNQRIVISRFIAGWLP